jgi:hypothetical protein
LASSSATVSLWHLRLLLALVVAEAYGNYAEIRKD